MQKITKIKKLGLEVFPVLRLNLVAEKPGKSCKFSFVEKKNLITNCA